MSTTKRRDELVPGDAFRSSHGYVLCVTRVHYGGSPDTPRDERTIQVWGDVHGNGSGVERTECYPGRSLVTLVARCSICHGVGEHTLACPTRWYAHA